jgi:hypothetical protein
MIFLAWDIKDHEPDPENRRAAGLIAFSKQVNG